MGGPNPTDGKAPVLLICRSLLGVAGPVRVPFMDQIDLFKIYSYLIGILDAI